MKKKNVKISELGLGKDPMLKISTQLTRSIIRHTELTRDGVRFKTNINGWFIDELVRIFNEYLVSIKSKQKFTIKIWLYDIILIHMEAVREAKPDSIFGINLIAEKSIISKFNEYLIKINVDKKYKL